MVRAVGVHARWHDPRPFNRGGHVGSHGACYFCIQGVGDRQGAFATVWFGDGMPGDIAGLPRDDAVGKGDLYYAHECVHKPVSGAGFGVRAARFM